MCFEGVDGVFEFLRGTLPYYTIAVVPLLIVISPMTPVLGAHEFTVYRMQQFDLHGVPHGCRSSLVNMEAKTLYTTPYLRRCVVTRLAEFSHAHFQDVIQQNAGGLLILIPKNFSALPEKERIRIMELEKSLLDEEVSIPVYFAEESEEIRDMYYSMERSPKTEQKAKSAAEEIISSITSSGFQLVVSGSQPKPFKEVQISSIQGKLSGFGIEEQLPTIAIVAHYDAYGIAPSISYGADSNGSGVAALLELARLLSRLYTSSRTHPRFNLIFLLSGGGKFNFQGTKKWIEDNIDSSDGSLLPDVLYTVCLDSLGNGDTIYMHVSKPPKEGSSSDVFFKELKRIAHEVDPKVEVSLVHKKINLAEEQLAWEHERFSIRRLPGFTVSHLQSPKTLSKHSIVDTRESVNIEKLGRNVKILAETLAGHMYNISGEAVNPDIFINGLEVRKLYLKAWMDYLTLQPRSAQLFLSGNSRHPLVTTLEQALSRYLKDVRVSVFKPDKREPEIIFYDPVSTQMNAYRVKPAIFDLFLALIIGSYLGLIYLLITELKALIRNTDPVFRSVKQNFIKVEAFIKYHARPLKTKQG